ncbi:MAG TPA: two-component regulator propeller domain-containing protein, partial [Chloroflexota bacterium]|nr:two-component regulator propeller domain-containing protein [Chloroflexota bacterium]
MNLTAVVLLAAMLTQPAGATPNEQQRANPAASLPRSATFGHLTTQDGLSDQSVTEIAQDSDGFIWLGTSNGLDRFDGYEFVHFRHEDADEHSLSANLISALYADRQGNLWAGTRAAGLNLFDSRTQQFTHFRYNPNDPTSLSDDAVRTIFEDRAGVLWVGTENGLARFDRAIGTFSTYRHDDGDPSSLGDSFVRSLAEDRSGALWVGTRGGLNRMDRASGTFVTYRHDDSDPNSLSNNQVWEVLEDHLGALWLATNGGGLERFDPRTGQFSHYRRDPNNPNSLSTDSLDSLYEDEVGRLWIGTFGGGLNVLDPERKSFTIYRNDPGDPASLSYDQVPEIMRDRSGLVWLGSGGAGVNIYNPQQQAVTVYRQVPGRPETLATSFVTAVLEDRDGAIWVGTRNRGLERLDPQTGVATHYAPQLGAGLGDPWVSDLQVDSAGALWIATYGGGVYRLNQATGAFTAFRNNPADPNSLANDQARQLRFDPAGNLWITTNGGGLNRLDPGTGRVTAYRPRQGDPRSPPSDLTSGLDVDYSGAVWAGTPGNGLVRLDPNTGDATRYRHAPADPTSLSDNFVSAVYVDRAGVVWVGTQGAGLNRFDPASGAFMQYHQADGLAGERIQSIIEDGSPTDSTAGNLWIVTDRALSRLDRDRQTFRNYDATNGLPRTEYTNGSYVARDGDLLIGNLGGLVVFDPTVTREDMYAPRVVFTDLLLNNKSVSIGDGSPLTQSIDRTDSVSLSYTDRVVAFEFSLLNYRAPVRNRYRYKLDGFDQQWTEVDASRRLVTYTNLNAGSYVLRVAAANPDGVWTERERTIALIVTPPWWEAWWFRGLLVVLIVGARTAAYAWRVRTLKAQQRRLEVLVRERTRSLAAALETRDVFLRSLAHDLKAPVTSLAWQVQLLQASADEGQLDRLSLQAGLQSIGIGATELVSAIDELHDLTRLAGGEPVPLQREPVDLVALARRIARLRAESSRQNVDFHTEKNSLTVDADSARLARVLDNLLDNAT